MLIISLIYHIMLLSKLSIKGFLHLLITSFFLPSFLGMSAAFQSLSWAKTLLKAVCLPDETCSSLKYPCLPRQLIQLSGTLTLHIARAELVKRSAGIATVIKRTNYYAKGGAFLNHYLELCAPVIGCLWAELDNQRWPICLTLPISGQNLLLIAT